MLYINNVFDKLLCIEFLFFFFLVGVEYNIKYLKICSIFYVYKLYVNIYGFVNMEYFFYFIEFCNENVNESESDSKKILILIVRGVFM